MSSEDGYEPDGIAPEAAPLNDGAPADSRVQAGLDALDGLHSQPLAEHAPVYEALHEELQSVLAEIDGA
jgi:type III secretory pathway lipoprotein EscJ